MSLTMPDDAGRWTELLTDITTETPQRKMGLTLRNVDGGGRFVTVDLVPMASAGGTSEVVVSFSSLTGAHSTTASQEPSAVSA
jgi:hypothetical protein